MKSSMKKLLPIISGLSAVAIVTPLMSSCSNLVSYEWYYGSGQPFLPERLKPKEGLGKKTPTLAMEEYFSEISKNKKILLNDFSYGIVTEQWKQENLMYLGMWIGDIDTQQQRASFNWNVTYLNTYPIATTCRYDCNVKVSNLPFTVGRAIVDGRETLKGMRLKPLPVRDLKEDHQWEIEYYLKESSPLGVAERTYLYSTENWNEYPLYALTDYILPCIEFNSNYFSNIELTDLKSA